MNNGYLRTYAQVSLGAVRHNLSEVRRHSGTAMVMAVIKTDGYGHGAVEIGKAIADIVDFYGVATVEEALELREAGLTLPILILGYVHAGYYEELIRHEVRVTVYSEEMIRAFADAALRAGMVGKAHIALDTGMTRIGFTPTLESAKLVAKLARLPQIELEGLFSHFSCADMEDKTYSRMQWERFDSFAELLAAEGVSIPVKHLCNSAGIMEFSHHRLDMVRSGIITYGLYPSDEVDMQALELRAALEWKAHIVNVMDVPAGVGISYGATYVTQTPRKIATVSIGYGDGYPRNLSNKGYVLVHGSRAPITGRVCMDQMMIDVTGIDGVKTEDEVTLVGRDGGGCISMEEIAALAGTFNYEFACNIGKRVPRVYI